MSLSSSRQGRSLELFFIDGRPDGMLTAEVFNWTGHVLAAPRTQIGDALLRSETDHAGVYLLLGETDHGSLAYIGEGEVISDRIRNHDAKKDWWSRAVFITTSANNLNKAHIRYLESRLIQVAYEIGRMPLENGNNPALPGLSEAAMANMEAFLDYLFLVLPAIGIDMFVRRTRSFPDPSAITPSPHLVAGLQSAPVVFEMALPKYGIHATAQYVNKELVVEEGSKARKEWVGPLEHNYRQLFEELVKTNVLVLDGEHRRFVANYAFSSPSAAGAMICGRSCNGPLTWTVVGTGETYRDWEQRNLRQ